MRGVFWTIAGNFAGNFDNTLHVVGLDKEATRVTAYAGLVRSLTNA